MIIQAKVGDKVEHDDGRTGEVIEVDIDRFRARVKWNMVRNLRTWISFERLTKQVINLKQ